MVKSDRNKYVNQIQASAQVCIAHSANQVNRLTSYILKRRGKRDRKRRFREMTERRIRAPLRIVPPPPSRRRRYTLIAPCCCSFALAEMKEKIKILQNEVEILRSESVAKEKALSKERLEHTNAFNARDQARA
eukprot:4134822-Pleurochrysis_carterae.AAC.4